MSIRGDQRQYRKEMNEMDQRIDKKSADLALKIIEDAGDVDSLSSSIDLDSLFAGLSSAVREEISYWYKESSGEKKTPKNYSERYWTDDGLNLSKRMRRATKSAQRQIKDTIRESLKNSEGAIQLSRKIESQIRKGSIPTDDIRQDIRKLIEVQKKLGSAKAPKSLIKQLDDAVELGNKSKLALSYKRLINALEVGDPDLIEKAFVNATRQKAGYISRRIARTETARAYFEGTLKADADDETNRIVAYKWNLNPNRSFGPDICDIFAKSDFGLGTGVFPANQMPQFPAHPNCMCFVTPVYEEEIPGGAKFDFEKGGKEFLSTQSDADKRSILGVGGSERFKKGESWRKEVRQYGKPTTTSDPLARVKTATNSGNKSKQDLFEKQVEEIEAKTPNFTPITNRKDLEQRVKAMGFDDLSTLSINSQSIPKISTIVRTMEQFLDKYDADFDEWPKSKVTLSKSKSRGVAFVSAQSKNEKGKYVDNITVPSIMKKEYGKGITFNGDVFENSYEDIAQKSVKSGYNVPFDKGKSVESTVNHEMAHLVFATGRLGLAKKIEAVTLDFYNNIKIIDFF